MRSEREGSMASCPGEFIREARSMFCDRMNRGRIGTTPTNHQLREIRAWMNLDTNRR